MSFKTRTIITERDRERLYGANKGEKKKLFDTTNSQRFVLKRRVLFGERKKEEL